MLSNTVSVWKETLVLPSYAASPPERNPLFYERRNVQGAKGNIYPNPFIEQLSDKKVEQEYEALFLENDYLQIILLPELGGRIFAGLDKTNQYDFFYRHKVIKPALIGLLGPWISGGVEFNWPQHHRPSTFMSVPHSVEEHDDGSTTVWMGEHEPMNRSKGMVGICLYPGKALVETKVRLYNRTPNPQTFLWWANAAVCIHDQYQVIFPPDVHHAQFHTKQFATTYPIAKGTYGDALDYGDGTDVSWYINTPIMTSFFAGESKYDFFGGYDHAKDAGVVHVANHHISPGKKFFTWSNGPAGHRWQRNLMDDGREYLELMAGVYSDNQPDFSWIAPYETKSFSQFWYPIQKIGPMKNANTRAAVNLEVISGAVHFGVYVTEICTDTKITLELPGRVLLQELVDLSPDAPYLKVLPLPDDIAEAELLLRVQSEDGCELIRYTPEVAGDGELPEPFQPPKAPDAVETSEELYLAGLHLEQYRHPTLAPEPYWEEALRRDPGDSRCNLALGRASLRRGLLAETESFFRTAIQRATRYNPNPYDAEAYYNLGLTLKFQGRSDEAYDAFYKAIWNYAWQSPAYYALAQIDCLRRDYVTALEHLERALQGNTQFLQARNLKTAVLRIIGRYEAAEACVSETCRMDPLDFWAQYEGLLLAESGNVDPQTQARRSDFHALLRNDTQTCLDLVLDYAAAGLWAEAYNFLEGCEDTKAFPMTAYAAGYFAEQQGNTQQAFACYADAAKASPDYCFPSRLEEMLILQHALSFVPGDARANYYLGNLLYDKRRYAEAVACWKEAVRLDAEFSSIPWRNLGLAAYNIDRDAEAAKEFFEKARKVNPQDVRLLYEFDQLLQRMALPVQKRIERLERNLSLVEQYDVLVLNLIKLYNAQGKPEKALDMLSNRIFHPWEGGEGMASGQYMAVHRQLGRRALDAGEATEALKHFEAGLTCPENLGEIPWEQQMLPLLYFAGLAHEAADDADKARLIFEELLTAKGVGELSPGIYYQALARRKLGDEAEANRQLRSLLSGVSSLIKTGAVPDDYFGRQIASSVFDDDITSVYNVHYSYLAGLAHLGLAQAAEAEKAFAEVLAIDPSHVEAREEHRHLL